MNMLVLTCIFLVFSITNAYFNPSTKTQKVSIGRNVYFLPLKCTPEASADLTIKQRLTVEMKDAMKSKNKSKLSAVKSILNAIKQKEIDERIVVDDEMAISILSKLVKQRRESILSYSNVGRTDLVEVEQAELDTITSYLPKQMTVEEISTYVTDAILKTNSTTIKDMGKVMAILRPQVAGKADISAVGEKVKQILSGK